jgi:hypothetical protein
MTSNYNIENLHKASMVFLEERENSRKYLDCMPFSTYIGELRTITLGVPRQSGKTKYLLELKDTFSSVMFVANQRMLDNCCIDKYALNRSNVVTFDEMFSVIRFNRGIRQRGLKYSLFLVDEYSFMRKEHENNFSELLTELKAQDLFTDDFYVLKIGTPVF